MCSDLIQDMVHQVLTLAFQRTIKFLVPDINRRQSLVISLDVQTGKTTLQKEM